jgi:hypothetical protein
MLRCVVKCLVPGDVCSSGFLPSRHVALGSILSTSNKKKKVPKNTFETYKVNQ